MRTIERFLCNVFWYLHNRRVRRNLFAHPFVVLRDLWRQAAKRHRWNDLPLLARELRAFAAKHGLTVPEGAGDTRGKS